MKFVRLAHLYLFLCVANLASGSVSADEAKQSPAAPPASCALKLTVPPTSDPAYDDQPDINFTVTNLSHLPLNVRYGGFNMVVYHIAYVANAAALAIGAWQNIA